MPDECLPCRNNGLEPGTLPLRERVYDDGLWRVAHAFNSALPGWMVVIARRHITSLADLTLAEAVALGPLLRNLSLALEHVTGAAKAYVVFFAEAKQFPHVHIHVVPRPPELPEEHRGPGIFALLARPEADWISAEKMDRIAGEISTTMREMAA
jgi:diadenosine tetraphosphate (Ap4A) HIT family hydrolase